jgi:hypothetical protein
MLQQRINYNWKVHMEQEKTRLRDDSTKWEVVSQAISNTFNCVTDVYQTNLQFKLYPNPANNSVNVKSSRPISKIVIYDIVGQRIKTRSVNSSSFVMNISELARGAYLVIMVSFSGQTFNSTLMVD